MVRLFWFLHSLPVDICSRNAAISAVIFTNVLSTFPFQFAGFSSSSSSASDATLPGWPSDSSDIGYSILSGPSVPDRGCAKCRELEARGLVGELPEDVDVWFLSFCFTFCQTNSSSDNNSLESLYQPVSSPSSYSPTTKVSLTKSY